MAYLWVKALHVIAVISWMAGILYLWRLFIYHVEKGLDSNEIHDLLSLMEHRLYRYITRPAMLAAWAAGIIMASMNQSLLSGGWFHVKVLMVILLTASTSYAHKVHIKLKEKRGPFPSSKALRIWNEVPTLLMIIIVILVIVRPF